MLDVLEYVLQVPDTHSPDDPYVQTMSEIIQNLFQLLCRSLPVQLLLDFLKLLRLYIRGLHVPNLQLQDVLPDVGLSLFK